MSLAGYNTEESYKVWERMKESMEAKVLQNFGALIHLQIIE